MAKKKSKNINNKKKKNRNVHNRKRKSDIIEITLSKFDKLEEEESEVIEEVEDNPEFIKKVKEFEKKHNKSKLINVFNYIGEPDFKPLNKLGKNSLKKEYNKIITLLDKYKIIVHFNNDYPLDKKYIFITEEIFRQDIEDYQYKNNHINFIYEDFHPEVEEDIDEFNL